VAPLLYTVYNIATTLVSLGAGHVSDRIGTAGPRIVLVAGVIAFAVAFARFAVNTTTVPLLHVSVLLAGVGIGCAETAEHALVAHGVPTTSVDPGSGCSPRSRAPANLAAFAVAGLLRSLVSPNAAFIYLCAGWQWR
jgi:MFS family permease